MEIHVGSWIFKDDDEATTADAITRAQAALEKDLTNDRNAD